MRTYDVYMTDGSVWKDQTVYDEYGDRCERLSDIDIAGRHEPAIIAADRDGNNRKILNKFAISTIVEIRNDN